MKYGAVNRLVLTALINTLVGVCIGESLDPRFPNEWHTLQVDEIVEQSWWPRARIQHLEDERDLLLKKIETLPQHSPKPMSDYLGYHSGFDDPASDGLFPAHELVANLVFEHVLDSIALAPAINPLDPDGGSYAFPTRFKIEVMRAARGVWNEKKRKWGKRGEVGEWMEVVNWMEKDFPDPGPYPVYFSGINQRVSKVRITVPQVRSQSGSTHYALGEIYLFRRTEGEISDNMAVWGSSGIEIEASDSLSMPPLWDVQYLYDSVVGIGVPLSEKTVENDDLVIMGDDESQLSDRVQLIFDLGEEQRIGRIDFWSAGAPHQLAVPSFGFPGDISIELSNDPNFEEAQVFSVEDPANRLYLDNRLIVICKGYNAQYIRVTLNDLQEYKGQNILGLGEISVSEYGIISSAGCKVSARGVPDKFLDQLPNLVDGFCKNRRILTESEWIKGLAKRRPLDRRLAIVDRELILARERWRMLQLRSTIFGGVSLCVVMILGRVFLMRQRRRVVNLLKSRIARDLHDEVGSNLGSIALVAERMEKSIHEVEVRADLVDLALLAREASVSLGDIVWVTDQSRIYLPDLVQKLVERSELVLCGMELSIDIHPGIPDLVVPLTFKRNIVMFFKEVVHNCVRHSNATKMQIEIAAEEGKFSLRLSDNGCGFDPATEREGWGLNSMEKRAADLGGSMELLSQIGAGTTVILSVPLRALLVKKEDSYTTSN